MRMKLLLALCLAVITANAAILSTATNPPEGGTVTGELAPITITALPTYTLNASALHGAAVSRKPNLARYPAGTEVTVTVKPLETWKFVEWTGDAEGTNLTQTVIVDRDLEMKAILTTTMAANVSSGEGSVSLYPQAEAYPGGSRVLATAIPADGFYFDYWTGLGTWQENPRYFTVLSPDGVTSAVFKKLPANSVSLTLLTDGLGYIETDTTKRDYYSKGSTVTLTAVSFDDETEQFLGWSGAVTGQTNPITLTLTTNMVITAHFTRSPFLSISKEPDNRISLFAFDGLFGDVYRFESSTNLIDWVPIQKRTNFHDTMELFLPAPTGSQMYRVVVE